MLIHRSVLRISERIRPNVFQILFFIEKHGAAKNLEGNRETERCNMAILNDKKVSESFMLTPKFTQGSNFPQNSNFQEEFLIEFFL